MLRALLYLRLTSLKNLLVSRAKRLRQPKYLVGAIVGVAYFWFFFFRHVVTVTHHGHGANAAADQMQAMVPHYLPVAMAAGTLLLFAAFLLMWLIPSGPAALGFTEAEIAFLFPAPYTRRSLVHFKLLSSQVRSLTGALFMVLFSNRWTFLGGNALTHAAGWWFVFSAINLHLTGSSFTLTRLANNGLGVARRRLLILALVVVTVATTLHNLPPSGPLPDFDAVAGWVNRLAATTPLAWLLWPVKQILAPFFAADLPAFAWALGPALLVLLAHYFWVVRSVVSFEEASIVRAEKRAERQAAWRSGERRFGSSAPKTGRKPPFVLAATGRPEAAFLWKNLLSTSSLFSIRTLVIAASLILFAGTWLRRHEELHALATGFGVAALMICLYLMLIGPQFARQDIRQDLANADILKTYPLAGWQIILGEILTPVAILTGLCWLLVFFALLTIRPPHGEFAALFATGRPVLVLCATILFPALVTLQLLVPNAATLLFPAWFQSAGRRERGVEVMGQRMLFLFAQAVTMIVTLIPAALVAAGVGWVANWIIGPRTALFAGTLLATGVLLIEAGVGLWWLGRRFEGFDLSSELRP